jgi:hypothetical protein
MIRSVIWDGLFRFQMFTEFRTTIIIVFIVTFTLYGIEGIAEEIGHQYFLMPYSPTFRPLLLLLTPRSLHLRVRAFTNCQMILSAKMPMVHLPHPSPSDLNSL